VLTALPNLVVRIDLTVVNGFQKPVVLMAGTTPKAAQQVKDILVVNALGFEFVDELLLRQTAAKESKKSPLQNSNALFTKTGPPKAHLVYTAYLGRVGPSYRGKRRNIACNG